MAGERAVTVHRPAPQWRDVAPLLQPRIVAVIGASATRQGQGNGVLRNLREVGYAGQVIPVHPTAAMVDGHAAVSSIAALPEGTDTAVVAIPAPAVTGVLADLQQAGVRSAVVFSNGFSAAEQNDYRRFAVASPMAIHGPNCMGIINITDPLRLYPSTVTDKVVPGKVALVAQSGSAAISLMNSTATGLSKVITMGSEWQVTAPDYMRWLADDLATSVVGIVLESIQHPAAFAEAAAMLRDAGKGLVVLKVGRSDTGAAAVQAHTGALISPIDAYDRFFTNCGVPTARDYEELIATIECFATCTKRPRGARIGIIGISGGETALACDVVTDHGLELARWSEATTKIVRTALSGAAGVNPLDLGATPNHTVEQDDAAVRAVLGDDAVDQVLVVQDAQATLTPTMRRNYTPRILSYGEHGAATEKPFVMVSPTSENTHPEIVAAMAQRGVPVLRGLRAGVAAMRNLNTLAAPAPGHAMPRAPNPTAAALASEVAACDGPLPAALATRILTAYGVPLVRSALVASEEEALAEAAKIGFPLVAKIASPDVPHRSELGGVVLGIADNDQLATALRRMRASVLAARPNARIAGFELQEELVDCVEAAAGFIAARPFGALMMVGTGGVLVELAADRAVELAPVTPERARAMIADTKLGQRLAGYRTLLPPTDTGELGDLVSRLSTLAADLPEIAECDLNPVLIRKGSGEVRVVDALLVTGRPGAETRA